MASKIKIQIGTETYTIDGAASEDTLSKISDSLKKALNGGSIDPKNTKAVNDSFDKMRKGTDDLDDSFDDLLKSTDELDDSFEDMIKTQKKRDADSGRSLENFFSAVKKGSVAFGSELSTTVKSVSKNLLQVFQSSDSPEAMIRAMSETIDQAITVISEGLSTLAKLIPYAGAALAGLTSATADALKFANDFLSRELQIVVASYTKVGESGTMLARGMTELVNDANNAGLGVQSFSEILVKNAGYIRDSGLGMTLGTKKLSEAIAATVNSTDGYRKQLFEMGFSIADQGEIVAATMANLARQTNIQNVSSQEIAKDSFEYAKNLRLISDITGQTAQQQMDAQRQASFNVAVQAKLQQMGGDAQKKFNEVLAATPEQLRPALEQMLVLGTVTDKTSAVMLANNSDLNNAMQISVASIKDTATDWTNLSEDTARNYAKANASMIKDPVAIATSLAALAGVGGDAAALGTAFDKLNETLSRYTLDGIDAATTAQKNLLQKTDPLTSNFADLSQKLLDFQTKLETFAIKALPTYSTVLEVAADALGKGLDMATTAVKNFANALDATNPGGPRSHVASILNAPQQFANKMDDEYPWLAAIDKFFKSGQYSPKVDDNTPAYADGGIASGSVSGYTALLHGTEAVVPLPDGNSIPVQINTNGPGIPDSNSLMQSNEETTMKPLDKAKDQINDQKLVLLLQTLLESQNDSNQYIQQLIKILMSQGASMKDLISLMTASNNINEKIYRNSY